MIPVAAQATPVGPVLEVLANEKCFSSPALISIPLVVAGPALGQVQEAPAVFWLRQIATVLLPTFWIVNSVSALGNVEPAALTVAVLSRTDDVDKDSVPLPRLLGLTR